MFRLKDQAGFLQPYSYFTTCAAEKVEKIEFHGSGPGMPSGFDASVNSGSHCVHSVPFLNCSAEDRS